MPGVTPGRPPVAPGTAKNIQLATPFQQPVADTSLIEELAAEDATPGSLAKPRPPSAATLRQTNYISERVDTEGHLSERQDLETPTKVDLHKTSETPMGETDAYADRRISSQVVTPQDVTRKPPRTIQTPAETRGAFDTPQDDEDQ